MIRPPIARLLELLTLFLAAPLLLAFAIPPRWVIPSILLLALVCTLVLVRDPTFDRKQLWNAPGLRAASRGIIGRVLLTGACMVVALWLIAPERLFELPRKRPEIWALILFGYPLVSAYPQELAFRVFFRHRYRDLFRGEVAYLLVNGALFGAAHLVMRNPLAVVLSAFGGVLLAWSYERRRACAAVWLEHALYGCLIFTIGWGWWFYGGAIRV